MPSLLRRLIAPRSRTVERDTIVLELGSRPEVEIQRVRDPRAKRIKLSVDERGARLTLPLRASLVSGDRFLHDTASGWPCSWTSTRVTTRRRCWRAT